MTTPTPFPERDALVAECKRLVDKHVGVVREHIRGDAHLLDKERAWSAVMGAIDRLGALAAVQPEQAGEEMEVASRLLDACILAAESSGGSTTRWRERKIATRDTLLAFLAPRLAAVQPVAKPVSKEVAAEVDAALDLEELPPIRLPRKIALYLRAAAKAEGVIVQALVREILVREFSPEPEVPTAPAQDVPELVAPDAEERLRLSMLRAAYATSRDDTIEYHRWLREKGRDHDAGIAALKTEPESRPAVIHCGEAKKIGGCQLHNLHCGWPKCNEAPKPHITQPEA
jgi:hypothetical protein